MNLEVLDDIFWHYNINSFQKFDGRLYTRNIRIKIIKRRIFLIYTSPKRVKPYNIHWKNLKLSRVQNHPVYRNKLLEV